MAQYYCGNPICKAPIVSDSTVWPLRCERCNQQCYPENCMPGGVTGEGSYIHTKDGVFGLPTAVLMVAGPGGQLVPFRHAPGPAKLHKREEQRRPDKAL